MRAMWLGFGVAILIAVLSAIVMQTTGSSSAERFSGASTRVQ